MFDDLASDAPVTSPELTTRTQKSCVTTPFWQEGERPPVASVQKPKRTRKSLVVFLTFLGATVGLVVSLLALAWPRLQQSLFSRDHAFAFPVFPLTSLVLCVGLVLAGIGLALVSLAFVLVEQLIRPQQQKVIVPLTLADLDLPAEAVRFPASDGNHLVHGVFLSYPQATSTLILGAGYRRSYHDVLAIGKHLWRDGHNVLAFEYYGHGSTIGTPVTLGYRELHDFLGAVDYVKRRTPGCALGVFGYGMGGVIALMGSARCPEIAAVVTDSAFAVHWHVVEHSLYLLVRVARFCPRPVLRLVEWMVDHLLWLRAGYRMRQADPIRVMADLAPRAILLIHGLSDTQVSPNDARQLYDAALGPKELWLLPKTEHMGAYCAHHEEYVARLTTFFARLKQRPTPADHATVVPSPAHPHTSTPTQDPEQEVTLGLCALIAQVLALPQAQITPQSDLFQLGMDSERLEEFLSLIEQQFQVPCPAEELFDHPAIKELAAAIVQRQQVENLPVSTQAETASPAPEASSLVLS